MSESVISVEGVSKRYRIGQREKKGDTLVAQFMSAVASPLTNFRTLSKMTKFNTEDESVFWALRDVSFEVREGDVLGIIGRNGAGKSTLLKILSRITAPTDGQITIKGRVSSLLEVGTGFHPELTGRENIYMNGTILGMRKREIDRKISEIIDFSGIEKFVDTPVKFYSSGMKVRLGFSVAAHLEPDILVIDEVLAVGDIEFQKKCLGKMQDVAGHGRTVLFVSHNMAAVQNLCTRLILLSSGSLQHDGQVSEVIDSYTKNIRPSYDSGLSLDRATGSKSIVISSVDFISTATGQILDVISSGTDVTIRLHYHCENPQGLRGLRVAFALSTVYGNESFACDNYYVGKALLLTNTDGTIQINIRKWPLNVGVYRFRIHIEQGKELAFRLEDAGEINVEYGDFFGSGFVVPAHLNGTLIDQEWSVR